MRNTAVGTHCIFVHRALEPSKDKTGSYKKLIGKPLLMPVRVAASTTVHGRAI